MTLGTDPVVLDTTGETSPYPYFEYMRRTDPVWHGTYTDQSQMPEEMRPSDEWVLFGYDGVFQAFRDDKTFTSAEYETEPSELAFFLARALMSSTAVAARSHSPRWRYRDGSARSNCSTYRS